MTVLEEEYATQEDVEVDFDVVVVGAGFAGLYALDSLGSGFVIQSLVFSWFGVTSFWRARRKK